MSGSEFEFLWDSSISKERQEQINAWVETLSEEQIEMIRDIIAGHDEERAYTELGDER